MSNENKRFSFGERISRLLDVPADVCGDRLTVELRGRRHLLVCGVRGILEYSGERIRLSLPDGEVCVDGHGLSMTAYYRGQTGIDGEIAAVSFPRGDRRC